MTQLPERVQLRRSRGWRLPEDTVNCARPGRWGNPFPVAEYGLELALALFRNTARSVWNPGLLADRPQAMLQRAYEQHRNWLARHGNQPIERAHSELAGRRLACWCPAHQGCHVDILLELANEGMNERVEQRTVERAERMRG